MPMEQLPELKVPSPIALVSQAESEWFVRFSSYDRMTLVVAWMH